MKNFLHTLPYFILFLLLVNITPASYGQCLCSGGIPATPLTYYVKMDTTDVPVSTISFPKFDPSVGMLSCITFNDTTSLVTASGVRNTASSDVNYEFFLNVTNKIDGPGIAVSQNATRSYGPSLLTELGTLGDTTTYGPDTLFRNAIHQTNSTNVAPYLGTVGSVNFTYKVNGGLITTDGGINYRYQIHSKYWGAFRLTYYWCPNSVLASNIKNFAAYKKDKSVLLKWATEDKAAGTIYQIEYSTDGITFVSIGQTTSRDILGTAVQHEFQYIPGTSVGSKIYFRIRQTDAQGKQTYSPIRIVNMNENALATFIVYPNPVNRRVSMQFDRSLNGSYTVELTNYAGQIVYNRSIKLHNTNNVQFDLTNPPPSGMYCLKITDNRTKLSYSNKLIVQH
jgi:Secretion system C-terminal sorting domain